MAGNSLADLTSADLRALIGNRGLGKPGWDIGAAANDIEFNAAVTWCIDGVTYEKVTSGSYPDDVDVSGLTFMTEAGATTAVSALATGYDAIFLVVGTTSTTFRIVQGTAVATGGDCYCPKCPAGYAPVGAVKVANASGSDFTFGTTNLSTANVTDTYFDLSAVPVDPL